ncbi:zinc uptake protein ZrgA [Photobacterium indicum]|uniref:DUF2796 domain-containing protein n=1 Tax=Photobacterium indicum TaxID=81447 RepID=A0A2T3L359_9GAMM|nr:DUF2796 domain-containing protein [Photobacterium indicum]PSV43544.1 DUF2796 domain-containing protein [Photobacterium indicum]
MTFPSNISALAIAVSSLVSTVAFADDSFRQHDAHVHGVVELNIAQDGNDLLLEITAPGSDIVGFEHAPKNQEQTQALQQATSTLKKATSLFQINSDANCELTDSYVNQSLSKNGDDHRNHDDHDHSSHDDHDHSSHDDHDHSSHDDHDHSSHDDHDHSSHDDHDHSSHDDHDHSSHDDHDHSSHDDHDHSSHDDHDHHSNHDDHDHNNHDDHDHNNHDDHDHSNHDDHDHSNHDDHDSNHANKHGEFTAQYSFSCKNIAQLKEIKLYWFNHFPSTEKIFVQAITNKSQQANQLTENNATLKF